MNFLPFEGDNRETGGALVGLAGARSDGHPPGELGFPFDNDRHRLRNLDAERFVRYAGLWSMYLPYRLHLEGSILTVFPTLVFFLFKLTMG